VWHKAGAWDVRTVAEYVAKVAEYRTRAERAPNPGLKRRYADMAASYQVMADERLRMIAAGEKPDDAPQSE